MRFVPIKKPLPRQWRTHPAAKGLVFEADVKVFPRGRLAAKLFVFKSVESLRRFWTRGLGHKDLGRQCRGAVNALAATWREVRRGKPDLEWMEGDPRYFCIIGFCARHLTAEIIAHEAVHAAYCYEKRVRRNLFGPAADFDEERIAYPAGILVAAINDRLHGAGLYDAR